MRKDIFAFTRTGLVVVVAALALLCATAFSGVAVNRQRVLRKKCADNLGKLEKALQSFSTDNEGLLPDCTMKNPTFFGTAWPWDLTTNLVNELESRNLVRKMFYCPANPQMDTDSDWNYWQVHGGQNRVTGYGFLLHGNIPDAPNIWRTNMLGDGINPPGQTELTFDAVLSDSECFSPVQASQERRTSHLKVFSSKPAGGNIGFEDGHVDWRNFDQMQKRFFTRGFNPVTQQPNSVDWYF